ncbi:MAG: 60S ribosomal export protein NMD3 [Candidatus Aenigmarchaeota archaeon]|nr:60S ribosomal export protein NMD3 [Candidatus Aenigmarchaeota archaeon]
MKSKFCIKCGKKTETLFNGLCEECFKEMNELISVPEKAKISVCKICGRAKIKKWEKIDIDDAIKRLIKTNGKLEKIKIEKEWKNKKLLVKIKASGFLNEKVKKSETKEIEITIEEKLCDTCGKIVGGYYESVIQLRSKDKNKLEKTLRDIENIVYNNNGFIVKILKNKNGVDVYITPKSLLNKISRSIKYNEIKTSYTLVGMKDGKNLYRSTMLLRL